MISSLTMRHVRLRGGGGDGDEAEGLDEMKIASAHLHYGTAKRDLHGGAKAYRVFWDTLAQYLAQLRPSYLCGDFNMALLSVVLELRARGFQINLAARYRWQYRLKKNVRADSCGILRIGPCQVIRTCFNASALGLESPTLPANCSMLMETLRDSEGK